MGNTHGQENFAHQAQVLVTFYEDQITLEHCSPSCQIEI